MSHVMSCRGTFARLLAAVVVAAAEPEAACPASQPSCQDAAADEAALLQSKTKLTAAIKEHVFLASVPCSEGSSTSCNGNQCCPGTDASGGKTYPCPNAEPGWNQCEATGPPGPSPEPTPEPTTPAPTPEPTPPPTEYVDACGFDCSWLGNDACNEQYPPTWNNDKCANRCRVANGFTERRCYYDQGSEAVWRAKRNYNPQDVWENGHKSCDCQWMSSNWGLGDDCTSGCDASDCATKCRNANSHGTCLADWSA